MIASRSSRRAVLVFLLIAFGGAWGTWAIAWRLGVLNTGPVGQVVVALGAFSPALAAFVVRKWITREGFADAGLRLPPRGKWPYLLLAWLVPLPVLGMIVVLAGMIGIHPVKPGLPYSLVLGTLVAALLTTPLFFGEEFGWRGYLQARVLHGQPLLAALFTGLVWGVFHYPVILAGFEGYEDVWLGLLLFPVFTVLLSVFFGWLRLTTWSIWPVCLAHAAANFIGGSLSAYLFLGSGHFLLTSYAGVLGWIPLGIISLGAALLQRRQPRSGEGLDWDWLNARP